MEAKARDFPPAACIGENITAAKSCELITCGASDKRWQACEGRLRIKSRRRPTGRHVRYVLADIPPRAESEIFLAVAIDVPSISAISLATHTL